MSFKALLLALLLALPAGAAAETVAVLSSEGGAYMEAFSAFQAAYGPEVAHYKLSEGKPELPPQTRTVAAFGGKAAAYHYPPGTRVVYCMAPGIFLKRGDLAAAVKISLIPDFTTILSKLKTIQPDLKTLKVLWMAPDFGQFAGVIGKAGAALGMQLLPIRVQDPSDLPSILRREMQGMDAFWLPPDPLLITPENLLILREFSWSNGIPFYGSTKGMTREGAAASVGLSFKEMGAAAAEAALRLEAGETLPEVVFPGKEEITLNATAAKRCRLQFPRAIIDEAGYFFP
ncbi:MAG: hypothetical protein A2X31_09085 [Elusimicrobia bacterium GWB2_63_22]|nr:MAG: hypothetical protein A2X31_09085 [Elusimicrobia bacterium GWB2_63_22]